MQYRYYFFLQYKLLFRRLENFGLNPILAFIFAVPLFLLISILLFNKTEFAVWIYDFWALSILLSLRYKKRDELIKIYFYKKRFYIVRIIENLVVLSPFLIFLFWKLNFYHFAFLTVISFLITLVPYFNLLNKSFATPFSKRPFEFCVGSRRNLWIILLIYFLAFKAIEFQNYNLLVFCLLFFYLLGTVFNIHTEDEYYVWIFSFSAVAFIRYKILNAVLHLSILALPIMFMLLAMNLKFFYVPLLCIVIGNLFISLVILFKYSVYPSEINIFQSLALAASLLLPPLIIFMLPYAFKSAKENLIAKHKMI